MPRPNALKGFMAKYEASPTLRGLTPGGCWTGEVPEGSDGSDREMPYVQLESTGGSFEYTFEDAAIETSVVNVHFYTVGADALDELMDAWQDEYNWQDLPGVDGDTVCVELTSDSVRSDFVRDKNGSLVYFGSQSYLVKLFLNP